MARGRAHRYDSQRELILAQAAQLFARQGYSGTSMNQVAAACGISKPALYHYVRDKQQLAATIAQEHVARLEAVVREVEGLPLDPEQRVRELIVRFVSEYAGAQHAHRVLTEDVRFLDADDRERVLDAERRVLDAFAEALAAARPGSARTRQVGRRPRCGDRGRIAHAPMGGRMAAMRVVSLVPSITETLLA